MSRAPDAAARRRVARAERWSRALFAATCLGALALGGADRWVDTAPVPALAAPLSPIVTDADGRILRVFLAGDGRWRLPVSTRQVDPGYVRQLLAYEDRRFHDHGGVDPRAVQRAAWQGLRSGRPVSGASTLTMQVARLLDGRPTDTPRGKLRQIRLALALERRLSKQEILEIYLTRAPFGGNLEGVRAAALSYFGKDARRLSAAEAALLVALPQSPEARRPDRAPGAARAGRDRVLARAGAAGVLPADTVARAAARPVPARRLPMPALAWHEAGRRVAGDPARPVHATSLDARLQSTLEAMLAEAAQGLAPRMGAALVVVENRTGRVLARIGAPDPLSRPRAGFVDMTRAPRSPGSALKPLIYALGFERGLIHPETLIRDVPTDFGGYAPRNFDRAYQGTVSVRTALQQSLNVPAVAVLDAVGPARLRARLDRMGVGTRVPEGERAGLALALGGLGVTLEDMTRLYATLARLGADPAGRHLIERRAAWQVGDILAGAPAPRAGASGRIAFKTGTSYGHRDAWALGYDGAHTVGVWLGRPDGGALPGMLGLDTAAPLLFEAFARISPDRTALPDAPPGLLAGPVEALPPPLRRFGGAPAAAMARRGPEIAYPPDGATVALSAQGGAAGRLVVKLGAGRPPFTWIVNGRIVAADPMGRSLAWQPDGPGYVTVSVLDGSGAAARTGVFLSLD